MKNVFTYCIIIIFSAVWCCACENLFPFADSNTEQDTVIVVTPEPEQTLCLFENPLTDLDWLSKKIVEFEADTSVLVSVFQSTYEQGKTCFLITPCNSMSDANYSCFTCEGVKLWESESPCENLDIDYENKVLLWESPVIDTVTTIIYKGENSRNSDMARQNLVIRDNESWQNLISQVNMLFNVSKYFSETEIDFSAYMVIAIIDEEKGNGGWSIDVTNITELSDKITVEIANLKQGNGSRTISRALHIVKVPKSNKRVDFEQHHTLEQYENGYFLYGTEQEFIEAEYLVIKDTENLQMLVNRLSAENNTNTTSSHMAGKNLNFSRRIVIAVFDKLTNRTGRTIDITDVLETTDQIVVTVSNLNKGSVSNKQTIPYRVVGIPATNKKIIFEIN